MNAYDLANEILDSNEPDFTLVKDAANVLCQQADRIAMLEQESRALRKQLIVACNELMEIKR